MSRIQCPHCGYLTTYLEAKNDEVVKCGTCGRPMKVQIVGRDVLGVALPPTPDFTPLSGSEKPEIMRTDAAIALSAAALCWIAAFVALMIGLGGQSHGLGFGAFEWMGTLFSSGIGFYVIYLLCEIAGHLAEIRRQGTKSTQNKARSE